MSEINFPCLMESVYTGNVVEFYSKSEGKVISLGAANNGGYKLNECNKDFNPCDDTTNWKPYKQQENTMTTLSTKQQALTRLETIEAEQKELRKLLEAPEEEKGVGSLLTKVNNYFTTDTLFTETLDKEIGTKKLSEAYSAAFETFIKLRQCEGSVGAKDGVEQYLIFAPNKDVIVDYFASSYYKVNSVSPCFSTKEYAEAAIKTVGEFEIIQMFKTFSHYED